MAAQSNQILLKLADMRVTATRIFAIVIVLLILFTGHSFEHDTLIDISFEISGLILLSICSLGRLWALMYLTGYKSNRIITEGPFSMVRHPLYVFTFIGTVGIGLASENVLVLLVIIVFYASYYPLTILAEEKKLMTKFGQDYLKYMQHTPRFLPKLSLYREPDKFEVKTTKFVKNFVDAMWFIWMFPIIHFVELLQNQGVLPVVLRVP